MSNPSGSWGFDCRVCRKRRPRKMKAVNQGLICKPCRAARERQRYAEDAQYRERQQARNRIWRKKGRAGIHLTARKYELQLIAMGVPSFRVRSELDREFPGYEPQGPLQETKVLSLDSLLEEGYQV